MANQKLQSELARLRKQQARARHDEIFGGFSRAERAEYDARANRIHEVETELETKPAERRLLNSRDASGTKNPTQTLLRMLLVSLTAAGKKIRGTLLPTR